MTFLNMNFLLISIHAPRGGSDLQKSVVRDSTDYFNPRSPHGERQHLWEVRNNLQEFQSTLPAWGATGSAPRAGGHEGISIHAPRMGSDLRQAFQLQKLYISIHAPRMGSDDKAFRKRLRKSYFNPRSPHGERQASA